jgi:hypothetical protein
MKPLEDSVLVRLDHGMDEIRPRSRRARRALGALALAWLALAVLGATPPRRAAPAAARAPRPVSGGRLGGFADSGAYVRFYRNEIWGTISVTWSRDGRLESRTLRGRPAARADRVRIEPDSSGEWRRVWLGVSRDSALLERFGSRVALHADGRVDTLELAPGTMLDGTPALLSQVPRVYDRVRGGVQKIPVLILPMHQAQATVARLGTATRSIAGRPQRFERWRYEVPGSRYVLWTDGLGRVCLANDSTEHFGFVRAGYEALLGPGARVPATPMR